MQLSQLHCFSAAGTRQCPSTLPSSKTPLHALSSQAILQARSIASEAPHRPPQRKVMLCAASAVSASGVLDSNNNKAPSSTSPVAAAASRHAHLLDNLEQLDPEAAAFAPSFLEDLRARTARQTGNASGSSMQADPYARHAGSWAAADVEAHQVPGNYTSGSNNGFGYTYSTGMNASKHDETHENHRGATASTSGGNGNGHSASCSNADSITQATSTGGASTSMASNAAMSNVGPSPTDSNSMPGSNSTNFSSAPNASTPSADSLAASSSSSQQQLQPLQPDSSTPAATTTPTDASSGSASTSEPSQPSTQPIAQRSWEEWGEAEPVTDWGESLDTWFATPNQPGSNRDPTSYNGPDANNSNGNNGSTASGGCNSSNSYGGAAGYSQDPNNPAGAYQGAGVDPEGGGYAAPDVVPSDITLLSRSAADAVLPLPPNSQQASFYQPKNLQSRLIELLGSVGASVILSKSALLAAPALLYPVWRPWIRAGLRNLQLFTTQFKCIGLWRAQLLDWEVVSGSPSPYAALFGVQPVAIRLTIGDPWPGGASVLLEFPYEPRAEGLRVGEPMELLVLGTDDAFTQFKVVREVYAPESGLWLFDYPFVNRDSFLQLSLEIERARQAARAAAAEPAYATAAAPSYSEEPGAVYDLGPVGGGAAGWAYQQPLMSAAAADADVATGLPEVRTASDYDAGYRGSVSGTGYEPGTSYGGGGGSNGLSGYGDGQQPASAGGYSGYANGAGYSGATGSGAYGYGNDNGGGRVGTSPRYASSYGNGSRGNGAAGVGRYSNGQQAGHIGDYGAYATAGHSYNGLPSQNGMQQPSPLYDADASQVNGNAQNADSAGWQTYQVKLGDSNNGNGYRGAYAR